MNRFVLRPWFYLWASPWTLCGCLIGLIGVASGGGLRSVDGVVEFHGGFTAWLLRQIPLRPAAMTLGHAVIGLSLSDLEHAHQHELVHVRQYERWGPFFVPAYLVLSIVLWCRGKDLYLDNPFEIEAYRIAPVGDRNSPGD